ncbi:MAG: hypothetical protein ACD_19C00427G0002 [uncultured bacterium]|nr:MAG: hypothetical protein ACD_19C00427G0002 [uncultured bacterium]
MKVIIGIFLFILFFAFPYVVLASIEFNISKLEQIGDQITLDVSISGLTSQSCTSDNKCYLQGSFQKNSGDNYFGYSQNNSGDWYEYSSSLSVDYILANFYYFEPQLGNWSGQIKVKNSPTNSSYLGPGEYLLKLKRYSGKSKDSSGDSNPLTIGLLENTPSPSPTPTNPPTAQPTQAPTSSPTKSPTPIPTKTATPKSTPTPTSEAEVTNEPENLIREIKIIDATPTGIVAGATTTKKSPILAIILIILGVGFLGFGGYLLYNQMHAENQKAS